MSRIGLNKKKMDKGVGWYKVVNSIRIFLGCLEFFQLCEAPKCPAFLMWRTSWSMNCPVSHFHLQKLIDVWTLPQNLIFHQGASRVDVIFDQYCGASFIKAQIRAKRWKDKKTPGRWSLMVMGHYFKYGLNSLLWMRIRQTLLASYQVDKWVEHKK